MARETFVALPHDNSGDITIFPFSVDLSTLRYSMYKILDFAY